MNKSEIELFGRNNNLKLIKKNNKFFIKKTYAENHITKFTRLYTEFIFIKRLFKSNIKNIPEIQNYNLKKNYIIFNKIEGKKIKNIKENDLDQCLKFLKSLNKKKIKKKFGKFQYASDYCISYKDHVECVYKRIINLTKIRTKKKDVLQIKEFINKNLLKNYFFLKKNLMNSISQKDYIKKLDSNELILSPSDFGFHNILKRRNTLFFLDFEYSGFDDPLKLLSDFLCNPDYKISTRNKEIFKKKFLKLFYYKGIEKKFELIFKFHQLKWCTMLLNDIVSKKYQKRRQFVGIKQKKTNNKKKFYTAKKYYFNLIKI